MPPEDSGPLRALVLAAGWWTLAALGWSTGLLVVAAGCATVLAGGHWFSYHFRRQPPGQRKAVLASLTALAALWMLADLFTAFAGGRYPQAQFGAVVQAITSFDLRTRGNLYSTLTHSLLILYIAADLSFSPLLLVFLVGYGVTALGALALAAFEDARRDSVALPERAALLAPWGYWLALGGWLILGTAALALILPRGASGQMSPVAAGFTMPWGVRGQTVTPLFPFVQLGAGGLSGFSPTMDLSFRGRADDTVVLQVRSEAGSYWRGLTFDTYTGREWRSTAGRVRERRRADGTVALPTSDPQVLGGRRYVQTFFVVQDQPDALFTGYQALAVQAPTPSVWLAASEGTIQADRALPARSSYSVVSVIPTFDPDALRQERSGTVDRRAAGLDIRGVPDDLRYFQLPPNLPPRVADLAREMTKGAATKYDKALALEQGLRARYAYDLDLPALPTGVDAVDAFLFEQRRGFCQQFASAMAVMARTLGLPSRVVTGYLPGEYNALAGAYTVRARDAHSWVEIRFDQHGWVPFDPTPVLPAAQRTPERRGFWAGPELDLPPLGTALSLVQGAVTDVGSALAPLGGVLAAVAAAVGPWLALALGLGGLGLLARRRGLPWRRAGEEENEDLRQRRAVLAAYRRLERLLERRGLAPRRPEQTPQEYQAAVKGLLGYLPDVEELTEAAQQAAYDTAPCPPDLRERAVSALRHLERDKAPQRKPHA